MPRRLAPIFALFSLVPIATAASQEPGPRIFAVEPLEAGSRVLLGEEVAGAPLSGRYFVLDTNGLRCEARLVRSRELRSSLLVAGSPPHHYELRARRACESATPLEIEHLAAVGPLARVMAIGLAVAGLDPGTVSEEAPGAPMPAGRIQDQIELAIDLDGDRAADVLSFAHQRDTPARSRGAFRVEHHREVWSRSDRGWAMTVSIDWTIEAPIE
jgi:hypothetical protein